MCNYYELRTHLVMFLLLALNLYDGLRKITWRIVVLCKSVLFFVLLGFFYKANIFTKVFDQICNPIGIAINKK